MFSIAVEKMVGLELPLRNDAASMRSKRSVHSVRKDPKEDKDRIPHPSHRHASPSAPWPWVDLEDGECFRGMFDDIFSDSLFGGRP